MINGTWALQWSLGGDEDDAERRGWTISLAEPAVRTGRVDRPEVEVLASVETFWRLVDGSYSPVEAWRDGSTAPPRRRTAGRAGAAAPGRP